MTCAICGDPITSGEAVRYEVLGWERDRSAGGTNALELRHRTGKIAHARCVQKAKTVHPQQADLFGSDTLV